MARITLIKLRALGDTVLLTSSIQRLLEATDLEIDVLVPAPFRELLENYDPRVQVLDLPYGYRDLLRTGRALARRKPAYVCALHAQSRSAILAWLSGARMRSIHVHSATKKHFLATCHIPEQGIAKNILLRDGAALDALGLPGKQKMPQLHAEKALVPEPSLMLGLGASRSTKAWGLLHFVQAARLWQARTKGTVFFITGPGEEDMRAAFQALMPEAHAIHGSLSYCASMLQAASVFLGNDSGPRHMAASLGVPTVTLFGPENPTEWHPYDRAKHPVFFLADLPCRMVHSSGDLPWCGIPLCVREQHRCMQFDPKDVAEVVIKVMR